MAGDSLREIDHLAIPSGQPGMRDPPFAGERSSLCVEDTILTEVLTSRLVTPLRPAPATTSPADRDRAALLLDGVGADERLHVRR